MGRETGGKVGGGYGFDGLVMREYIKYVKYIRGESGKRENPAI